MDKMVKRAFAVSDGLASLANKKIHALVTELKQEGVLTKKEAESVKKHLSKAKTVFYDKLTRELKKAIDKAAAFKKSSGRSSKKRKQASKKKR